MTGQNEQQQHMATESQQQPSSSKMEIICAHLLTRLLETNDRLLPPDCTAPPAPVTRFDARSIPAITVEAYLARILRYAPCEPDVLILVLIHLERLSKRKAIFVNSWNVHRLLITSFMIGAKYSSDTFFTNTHYAKVGGLPTAELNKLEMEFLASLNFELGTSPYELHRTYELLLNHCYAYPELMAIAEDGEMMRMHQKSELYRSQVISSAASETTTESEDTAMAVSPYLAPVASPSIDAPLVKDEEMKCVAGPQQEQQRGLPTPPASPDSPQQTPVEASLQKPKLPMAPPPVHHKSIDVSMRNNSAPLLHFSSTGNSGLYAQQFYMQQQQQQKALSHQQSLNQNENRTRPLTTMMDYLKKDRAASMSPSMAQAKMPHSVFRRQTCRSIDHHYPNAAGGPYKEPWRQGSPMIGGMRS